MNELLVLRHGLTSWNLQKRLQGREDIPLCDEGIAQVSNWRIGIDVSGHGWFCSPLARARQTAALLGAEPVIEPALIEMSWGEWEGRRFARLKAELGKTMQDNLDRGLDFCPRGGESPRDVMQRLSIWLPAIKTNSVAVCHKGVLQALYALATGWDMLEKPDEKLRDDMAHLFMVENGRISAERMNIPLKSQ